LEDFLRKSHVDVSASLLGGEPTRFSGRISGADFGGRLPSQENPYNVYVDVSASFLGGEPTRFSGMISGWDFGGRLPSQETAHNVYVDVSASFLGGGPTPFWGGFWPRRAFWGDFASKTSVLGGFWGGFPPSHWPRMGGGSRLVLFVQEHTLARQSRSQGEINGSG